MMPSGSFDYTPDEDSPPVGTATPILVCRYDSTQESGQRYTHLPNIRCEQIQEHDGASPATAQFSYVMFDFVGPSESGSDPEDDEGGDDVGGFSVITGEGDPEDEDEPANYPSQFEETWPIASAPNDYKVQAGDELVVLAVDPDGNYRVRWHGFAKVPQVDLEPSSQSVTFSGSSVAERLWDTVVKGRYQRNGDTPSTPSNPDDTTTSPFLTDLESRFNPDDRGNCTPDDSDETYTDPDDDEESGGPTEWKYPVFLDSALRQPAEDSETTYVPVATFWTLGKLVRHLLITYNKEQKYVNNPDFGILDSLLSNRAPTDGSGFFDPSDPSTYVDQPVIIRDYDATNKPFMDVIAEQLEYAGFRMRFICEGQPAESDEFETQSDQILEEPYDYIEIYRIDASGPTDPKEVWLPVTRTPLNPDTCNVASFSAVNDFHTLVNQFTIETRPNRYEVSVVLAPGFEPDTTDATPVNQRKFLKSALDTAPVGIRQAYRYYIADELGEGHWVPAADTGDDGGGGDDGDDGGGGGDDGDTEGEDTPDSGSTAGAMAKTPFDFSTIFPPESATFETGDNIANDEDEGPDIEDDDDGQPESADDEQDPSQPPPRADYVRRYRPGLRTLFSKDPVGKPFHAQLALSRDFMPGRQFEGPNGLEGGAPLVWDGTGTWQVIDGGWELLKDRLGIAVICEDVNSWAIGKSPAVDGGTLQEPTGSLQGIVSIATPSLPSSPIYSLRQAYFYLRLTCVIESDECIEATAKKREATPYPFTIERRIDAKDHFVKNVIGGSSVFAQASGSFGKDRMAKDDTLAAQTHCEQMRSAHEFPPLAAAINIPWFAASYLVSDRIKVMTGRNVSFKVNAGSEQNEAESYPFVASVTWDFRGAKQSTTLHLSDRRVEPRHVGQENTKFHHTK